MENNVIAYVRKYLMSMKHYLKNKPIKDFVICVVRLSL